MTPLRSIVLALLAGCLLPGLAVTAAADTPRFEVAQSGGTTLEQAIRQVQRQYGGRIVSATTQVRNGREIHVIRVLSADGKVRTVRVNGRRVSRG